jgi:TetR/AcrR family transcriptional regulator, transcriptional repressor for nem operon
VGEVAALALVQKYGYSKKDQSVSFTFKLMKPTKRIASKTSVVAASSTKGQRTRADIIQRSAALMNKQGFLAAPLSAIMDATGLQKGGLYRHFESREALANEALDFCVAAVRERFVLAMQSKPTACEQLLAMIDAHVDAGTDVPLPGGCPIMNTAVETDHTTDPAHTSLRDRARDAMRGWHGLVQQIVRHGIAHGDIRDEVDPCQVATVFIACMEGAVLLTQLYGDASHMTAARAHLATYIDMQLRARPLPAGHRACARSKVRAHIPSGAQS